MSASLKPGDAPDEQSRASHAPVSLAAHKVAQVLAGVGVIGLLLLALGTALDVILRYGFAKPIPGYADVTALAGAVLLSACMPQVVASRSNVSIDFAGKMFGEEVHKWLDRLGAFVTFAFFSVMAWQYMRFALEMKTTGETMAVLRWPVWPWWTGVAIFIAITAVVALLTLLDEEPSHD
jgi:TRAP-type C4-dicarboxylate transport system permease small subunit